MSLNVQATRFSGGYDSLEAFNTVGEYAYNRIDKGCFPESPEKTGAAVDIVAQGDDYRTLKI